MLQVFDVLSGQLLSELSQGHFESINACTYNHLRQELYSAGNDGNIVAWTSAAIGAVGPGDGDGTAGAESDKDTWD